MSFLPQHSDRSSDRPSAEEVRRQYSPGVIVRPTSGHPLLRPQPAPSPDEGIPEGYSAEHLGFENQATIQDRPRSKLTMTGTVTGSVVGGQGTRRRKLSKRVRPRDTAPPIPSSFRLAREPAIVGVPRASVDKEPVESVRSKSDERGTKRHWWSRRRVESVVS
jgi:hypothetical protein